MDVQSLNKPKVDRLIAEARNIAKTRAKVEIDERHLDAGVVSLTKAELEVYLAATDEIDEAITRAMGDAQMLGWTPNTTQAAVYQAANRAGRTS